MSLAWHIFTTLSARVAFVFLTLVSSIALARLLGPEGRGIFALVLLVPELARSFGSLGLDQANTVYAGLEPLKRRALVWHSTLAAGVLGTVIATASMAYLALGGPGAPTLLRGPLWLYLLPLAVTPVALMADYWSAVVRGMNWITLINAFDVVTRATSLVLVLVLVGGLGLGVAGAVWADVIPKLGGLLALLLILRQASLWARPSLDRELWTRTTRFALPAYFSSMAGYLNYRVDQFIIAAFLPADQLAYYVIAVGLAERLWIVSSAVGGPLLPHLTNSPDRAPALAAVVARHVFVWIGAASVALFVLADVVVRLLYSADYAPSVGPLRWLLPGVVMLSIGKVLVAELLARTKIVYTLWVSTITAAVNVGANLVLVPRMGISGAAIASTISYTLLSGMVAWYYFAETKVRWTTLVPRIGDLQHYVSLARQVADVVLVQAGTPRRTRP